MAMMATKKAVNAQSAKSTIAVILELTDYILRTFREGYATTNWSASAELFSLAKAFAVTPLPAAPGRKPPR